MGFGSIFFGHSFEPIKNVIKNQLDKCWSVGPITPMAGELAKEITEVTKTDRVAFFNTGTESIMVALRIAKASTRKKNIVFFKGSYHGAFDPLMTIKAEKDLHLAQEMVHGVTQSILNESYLLEYGSLESLKFIESNSANIAAILVEPIQSRRPDYQPIEYLKKIRIITEENNIALIFDEIITGFRIGLGGCQELFGIKADIVTYGKVIGGGLPIGLVAGKSKFMDYIDGGKWRFNDDSYPKSDTTFVAGTFCHHPLAMKSAITTLKIMKESNGLIHKELNKKTSEFCARMNDYFTHWGLKIEVVYFGSLFRFIISGRVKLLYSQLLLNGVYIWEGRNCFLSPQHDLKTISDLESKIRLSCEQLAKQGILHYKKKKHQSVY